MLQIYIDADGCPVKDEVYRVARRYDMPVKVVANDSLRVPTDRLVERVLVSGDFDAADDWIVENAGPGDIVITADVPLASRAVKKGARVLGPKGREFTEESVGDALATRDLMDHLRQMGIQTGGPAPFEKKDRSNFLMKLDEIINAQRRDHG